MARGSDGRFIAGVELGLTDKLSGPLARLSQRAFEPLIKASKAATKKAFDTGNFTAWGKKLSTVWDPFTKASKNAEKAFKKAADLKLAGDGVKGFTDQVSGLVEKPIKTFMAFEKQMSSVKSALFADEDTAESRKAMEAVEKKARELGASTQFSATEAAGGMDILAKSFKDGPDKAMRVMESMPGILDLAAAGEVSIADASEVAASAMNQFNLEAKDMGRIGDVLAKTAASSATGINDIGEALKNSGVAAAGAGISFEKQTALIGALGNAGIKGGEAGTALRAMILRLQAPNKQAKSALDFLGVNTKDKKGNLRPIEDLLADIDKGLDRRLKGKDKDGTRRAKIMKGIFEDEAFSAANVLAAQAGNGELAKVIDANFKAAGTSSKMAKVMSDNAAGAMANYESAVEELQLTIGEKLIPKVTELFKWADETVTKFAAWGKENGTLVTVLGYTAGAVVVLGTAVWAGTTAVGVATTAWGGLTLAWGAARTVAALTTKGLHLLKLAALSNPVTAILVGIATAAVLIYEYWDPISSFFTGIWDSIASGAKTAFDWILDKINWIGEAIEDFKVSVMSEEEAAAYTLKKEVEFNVNKGNSSLFADDLDNPNSQTRGKAAFGFKEDPTLAAKATSGIKDTFAALQARGTPIGFPSGAPIAIPEGSMGGSAPGVDGALKITIDSETGKIKKTDYKSKGSPFQVQVNAGAQ